MKNKKIINYLTSGLLVSSGALGVVACETNSNSSVPETNVISPLNTMITGLTKTDFTSLAFNYEERVESETNMQVDSQTFLEAIFGLSKYQDLDEASKNELKIEDISVRRSSEEGVIRFFIKNHSVIANQTKSIVFTGFVNDNDFNEINGEIRNLEAADFTFGFDKTKLPSDPDNKAFNENEVLQAIQHLSQFEDLELLPRLTRDNINIISNDAEGKITLEVNLLEINEKKIIDFDGFYKTSDQTLKNDLDKISAEQLAEELGLIDKTKSRPSELIANLTEQTVADTLNGLITGTDIIKPANITEISPDDGKGAVIIKGDWQNFFTFEFQMNGYSSDGDKEKLNAAIANLEFNPDLLNDENKPFFDKSQPTSAAVNNKTEQDLLTYLKELNDFKNLNNKDDFVVGDIILTPDEHAGEIYLTITGHGENLNMSFTGFPKIANSEALNSFFKNLGKDKTQEILGWETDRLPSENDLDNASLAAKIKSSPELYTFSKETTDLINADMIKISHDDAAGSLKVDFLLPNADGTGTNEYSHSYNCQKAVYGGDLLNPDFWTITTSGVSQKQTFNVASALESTYFFADPLITHDGENYFAHKGDVYHFQNDEVEQKITNSKVDSSADVTIIYEVNWHKWLDSQGISYDGASTPEYRIIVYYTKPDNSNVAYFLDTNKTGDKITYEFSETNFPTSDDSGKAFNIMYKYKDLEKGSLFQSEKGNIWLGTYSGQLLKLTNSSDSEDISLNPKWVKNENVEKYHPDLKFHLTSSFLETTPVGDDNSTTIYFGMETYKNQAYTDQFSGFYTLNEETDEIKFIQDENVKVSPRNAEIAEDAAGNIFFTTWREGLYMLDTEGHFKQVKHKSGKYIDVGSVGFVQLSGDRIFLGAYQKVVAKGGGLYEIKQDSPDSDFYLERSVEGDFQSTRMLKTNVNGEERYYIFNVADKKIDRFLNLPPNAKYQYAVNEEAYQDTPPTNLKVNDIVHIRILSENSAEYKVVFEDESLSELAYTITA